MRTRDPHQPVSGGCPRVGARRRPPAASDRSPGRPSRVRELVVIHPVESCIRSRRSQAAASSSSSAARSGRGTCPHAGEVRRPCVGKLRSPTSVSARVQHSPVLRTAARGRRARLLEPVDEARDAALAEEHPRRQLAHPEPLVGRVREVQQHLVLREAEARATPRALGRARGRAPRATRRNPRQAASSCAVRVGVDVRSVAYATILLARASLSRSVTMSAVD